MKNTKFFGIALLLATLSPFASYADQCPNLSGVYDLSFHGSADGKITFTQNGCETVTWQFSSGATPLVLKTDGTLQKQLGTGEPALSGKFVGTCLVTHEYDDGDDNPADQTSYCVDSNGHFTETVISYTATLGTVMPPFAFDGVKE